MKKEFKPPMTARERLAAMLFIPMHAFIVPLLLSAAFPHLAREGTGALLTLVSYTVSFVYILIIAFNYLRASFSDIFDGLWAAIRSVALGMLIYFGSNIAINIFLNAIIDKLVNPNSQAVAELLVAEPDSMFVTTVLLAPVVEETMFRGALFGSIRLRSRAVAYIVSALAFAAYHLWPFLFTDMWRVNALYALQYIPASVILAWCYERGNSIWAPITLHALINLLANAAVRLGGAAA